MPPSTKPPSRICPSALPPWLSLYGQVEANRLVVRLRADAVVAVAERARGLRGEQVKAPVEPLVDAHGRVTAAAVELGENEEVAVLVLTGESVQRRVGVGAAVAALQRTTVLEEPEADVRRAACRVVTVGAEVQE